MADSRYAKKWGVTKLPALVYFRRRFPSIYRGTICDSISLIFLIISISISRWPTIRRWSSRVASKEPFPTTWVEYFHVRSDSASGWFPNLHCLFTSMFQTNTAASSAAETVVMRHSLKNIFDKVPISFSFILLWQLFSFAILNNHKNNTKLNTMILYFIV